MKSGLSGAPCFQGSRPIARTHRSLEGMHAKLNTFKAPFPSTCIYRKFFAL